jgi:hypothetical protein
LAYTYPRRGPEVKAEDSFLSALIRNDPEGASQTFPAGAPLVWSSGLLIEDASPVALDATVVGFARRAGQNLASGGISEYIAAVPGLRFFANFLNDTNPDSTTNALAAADLGTAFEMQKDTGITEDGGAAAWHVADATTTAAARMVSFESDYVPSNAANARGAAVADLNARVSFILLASALVV